MSSYSDKNGYSSKLREPIRSDGNTRDSRNWLKDRVLQEAPMKLIIVPLLILVVISLLSSCRRDQFATGPGETELEAKLTTDLPGFLRITSFKVEAAENIGDKVEPVFKSRFRATLTLQSDTFLEASREPGAIIVVPHLKASTTRELYGKAVARLKAGAWQVAFSFDNNPIPDLGKPKDFFSGGEVIERGSQQESTYLERRAKAQEQVTQEAVAAEKVGSERLRALLTSSLSRFLSGDSRSGNEVWPMRLRLGSFDKSTGHVVGQVDWPSLNASHKIVGDVVGNTFVFKETEFIKRGNAILNCVYTLTASSPSTLDGTYACGKPGVTHLALE